MIIENPDAFKTWLTAILEPLCDADPAALAKYVYALVKKDKGVAELREGMIDQLDVFLQHETKPFVDMLFKSLETQEYLTHHVEEKLPSPPPEPEAEKEAEVEADTELPAATLPEEPNGKEADIPARPRSPLTRRVVAPRAAPPPPPRAPPHEQTLVKVLPLTELLEEPLDQLPRRRDRRGDALRDKDDRRRRRSRSWERRARNARRHLQHPEHPERRRGPSRSPSPRGRYRNRSPPPVPLDRPPSRSRSRSPIASRDRLRVQRDMERERLAAHRDRASRDRDRERSRERSRDRSVSPRPDSRVEPDGYNKRRCRDFDEKGYCMRGDLCQWDHGTDPVVLEDASLTRVLAIPPPVPEYNPLAPDIWCAAFSPYGPPPLPHPPRELIPIPRVHHDLPPGAGPAPAPPAAPRPPAPHKKIFDYNRLGNVYHGPSRPPLPPNSGNCSLEVKKVPRGLNDITHLNKHFSKFGKIVNIQVCHENDPERALITFSSPAEASVAYKSTEAVLNNRFIKVFWHNPDNKQENMAPKGQQKPPERPSNQHPMSHNKVLINRDNMKATADSKQLQQQIEKSKEQANGEAPKKEPVKPAEKSKQVMESHKRAQALLETQLQQQLLLIQKLESGNVAGPQKAALLEAISSAQEGIEKLRKELVAYNRTLRQMQDESVARTMSRLQLAQVKKPKTREEAQKEILDAELDMFTKQQEGQDVTELAKKIADLRRQMSIHYPPHPAMRRPHSRGGRFNPASRFRSSNAGKGFVNLNQVVDHRPRALLISGFEPDDLDALQTHFAQFGEITGKEVSLAVPELTLQYRARAHAEQAALRGRNYNDRTLSITWVTNNKPVGAAAAPATNGDSHSDTKEREPSMEISTDALLRFDEEEEEDNEEDRSWRR